MANLGPGFKDLWMDIIAYIVSTTKIRNKTFDSEQCVYTDKFVATAVAICCQFYIVRWKLVSLFICCSRHKQDGR